MLDDDEYTEQELDGMNTWIPLTHEKLPSDPFTFYFTKLKSGSPEATELFMNPRAVLLDGFESLPSLRETDDRIKSDTKITTTIFGHERGLNLRLIYIVVGVDSQDNSVSITSHKATSS